MQGVKSSADRVFIDLPQNLLYKRHQTNKIKCFSSHLAVIFSQSNEARCWVENEDVVGAAPTGNAPTTSKWSTNFIAHSVGAPYIRDLTVILPEYCSLSTRRVNTFWPKQNGWQYADNICKCIFFNEKVWILSKILLTSLLKGSIENKATLVLVMVWPWTGTEPLPDPMLRQFNLRD